MYVHGQEREWADKTKVIVYQIILQYLCMDNEHKNNFGKYKLPFYKGQKIYILLGVFY